MNWLTMLLEKIACKHKWRREQQINAYADGYEKPVEIIKIYICSECGKFKRVKL